MKIFVLIVMLFFNIFATENIKTSDDPRIYLNEISKYAIKIGTGDSKDVYIFVDPMCKYSKKLLKKITQSSMLKHTNSYYIFLYRLQKFESDSIIQYIYQSEDRLETLLELMVDEEIFDEDGFEVNEQTLKDLKIVSDTAKKLDMKLRPYVISFEKGSKYCKVSEGTAPCLDEFEK